MIDDGLTDEDREALAAERRLQANEMRRLADAYERGELTSYLFIGVGPEPDEDYTIRAGVAAGQRKSVCEAFEVWSFRALIRMIEDGSEPYEPGPRRG